MFIPDRDHHIPLQDAATMTRRYRLAHPKAEKAGTFHADQVLELLNQPGCAFLRYYHGLDEEDHYAIILVAADHAGCDLTDGIIMEEHYPCPPFCAADSDLSSSGWVARAREAAAHLTPA